MRDPGRPAPGGGGRVKSVAVFASGGGSGLQAIIDACKSGRLDARVAIVISNNSGAFALERARAEGIPALHMSSRTIGDPGLLEKAMLEALRESGADAVFLSGYLKKIGAGILRAYEGRILNIHPSLLPRHGGEGMHGLNVHRAVLEAGDAQTGATVHRVSAEYDAGEIVAQARVQVLPGDTPETLAARVLALEHGLAVEALAGILRGI